MTSRRWAIALICFGCLCLVAALAVGGYNLWDDSRAQHSVDAILASLPVPTATEAGVGESVPPETAVLPDYVLDPHMDMPTQEVDGYRYIGLVSVPALELELPVMETWDYVRMRTAPCRYAGTAYLPGFVICAHNYTSHFGRLKNLSPGDQVRFTDMAGNVFSYEVAAVEILAPTAVDEMTSDDWDLTLFSCTLGGRTRVTVRCRQISQPAETG